MSHENVMRTVESDLVPSILFERAVSFATSLLENGRPGYDVPHTRHVVSYVMKICDTYRNTDQSVNPQLDPVVLYLAALFHDTGNSGLYDAPNNTISNTPQPDLKIITKNKAEHMKKSEEHFKRFIEGLPPELAKSLTETQVERICHLVLVHDRIDQLQDIDELVLMEADTLGALQQNVDAERDAGFTDKQAKDYILNHVINKRAFKFTTPSAFKELQTLVDLYCIKFNLYPIFDVKDLTVIDTFLKLTDLEHFRTLMDVSKK